MIAFHGFGGPKPRAERAPHYRASSGRFAIAVSDLQLRLPVAEQPGSGPVVAPAAPVMPAGARPAADLPPPRRIAVRVSYPSRRVIARDGRRPFSLRVRRRAGTLRTRVRRTDETTQTLRARVRVC